MTDVTTERLRRSADPADRPRLVRALVRAGQHDEPEVLHARYLAFVGVPWAREAVPPHPRRRDRVPAAQWSVETWVHALQRLTRPLPPVRVEVPCWCVHAHPADMGHHRRVHDCDDHTTLEVPAEHYLVTLGLAAVGRAAWTRLSVRWTEHVDSFSASSVQQHAAMLDRAERALDTLDACAQWLRCPCGGCERAWLPEIPAGAPPWLPLPWWSFARPKWRQAYGPPATASAAADLGVDVVEVMSRALREREG